MLRLATSRLCRRSLATTAAQASSSSADSIVQAAASILSFSTPDVLQPGSVIVNMGAETEIGQVVTVAAAMRGVTTINVVSQDPSVGYPDSVSHVYSLGGDHVITENFLGFRGFKDLVTEVCGEGKSPVLVVSGSLLVAEGTKALGSFKKEKSFTGKKSAIEDMQDNNMLGSARRSAALGSVVGKATIVQHTGSSFKGTNSGTEEQTQVANKLMADLSSIMAQ